MKTLWKGDVLALVKTDPALDLVARAYTPALVILGPKEHPTRGEVVHHCVTKISKELKAECDSKGVTYGKLSKNRLEEIISRASIIDKAESTKIKLPSKPKPTNGHETLPTADAAPSIDIEDLLDGVQAAFDILREQIDRLRGALRPPKKPVASEENIITIRG